VDRVRITRRDIELLEFASRQRIVLSSHAQALLTVSADAAASRMRALARAGLLDHQALFDRQPRCYWITRHGLQAIGSSLSPPRMDLRSYRHDIGVAWLWLAARSGAFGPLRDITSEREMRSRDAAAAHAARNAGGGAEPLAVRLGGIGPGGRERLHYPDLLLTGAGGRRVAVELELTSKAGSRRQRILAGYGADRRVDAVLYLVDSRAVARAIRSSAARLGILERVHVQGAQWGGKAPGHFGARSRAAERRAGLTR
jgi:hypothetical protein